MNLRDLKVFVLTQMANQLAEGGIDVDQIEQIKICDSQIPSNDNDDDLIVDNLYEFTEFFSKNVDRLV